MHAHRRATDRTPTLAEALADLLLDVARCTADDTMRESALRTVGELRGGHRHPELVALSRGWPVRIRGIVVRAHRVDRDRVVLSADDVVTVSRGLTG